MNKYTFLVFHKQYSVFLEKLRELGVVHVAEKPEGVEENDQLREKMQVAAHVEKCIEEVQSYLPQGATAVAVSRTDSADGAALLAEFEQLVAEKQRLQQLIQTTQKEAERMEIWGEYDLEKIQSLAQQGYVLQCWSCIPSRFNDEWVEQYHAIPVGQSGSTLCFATVSREPIAIEADQVNLTDHNVSQLLRDVEEQKVALVNHERTIGQWAIDNLNNLKQYSCRVQEGIDWQRVELNTTVTADDKLMLLEGYAPVDNAAQLKQALDAEDIYYEVEDVDSEDTRAPIKLKNNWFSRMYEVLTKMYGMPDYGEFDPTPILAPFFSLFFGMCMGDAGYGLALILLGFVLKSKMGESMKGMMNLVITLGIFTTVVGAFLGTFFGFNLVEIAWIPESVKHFIVHGQTEIKGMATLDNAMLLALGIGVFHVSIAMIVKTIGSTMRYGIKECLSTWGWTILIVGGVIVATLGLTKVIPAEITKWAFIGIASVAGVCIYLLNNLHRNPLINIGAGLYDTYNMATGLLGDILSYIRLYALGLAGGLLGGAFNQLAQMAHDGCANIPGVGIVLGVIFYALIFCFGHVLNIALSCLSAFVHPLRLSFVEYFKNAGYNGKGVEYSPFAVKDANK